MPRFPARGSYPTTQRIACTWTLRRPALVFVLATLNLSLTAQATDVSTRGYLIHVTAVETGPRTLDVHVTTTVPDEFTLTANLERHGMKDDDLYLGTGDTDVHLVHGRAHFVLNASGTEHFPADRYDAVVELHLGHPRNLPLAQRLHLTGVVTGKTTVAMKGKGPSASTLNDIRQAQIWVENTVNSAEEVTWDPSEYKSHLGNFVELSTGRNDIDPEIFKLYYFPRVDRTLQVNTVAGIVLAEQHGRGHWNN